ncbi:MAG: hypothetical protein HY711_10655 [Candidatus Melainabacteria bacterium]|nr:hypothetical protein [Candidatus Melainabacteria bacterium]
MAIDIAAKLRAVADIIEGRVVNEDPRVAICVKGSVLGFPATLEAIHPNWPFGVMYYVETQIIEDPGKTKLSEPLNLTVCPRFGRGLMAFFAHLFLFEARGMSVNDKRLESRFIISYNDGAQAERYVKYPGNPDRIQRLEEFSKFSELTVRSDAGLYLAQPQSFRALDLDICRETFRLLGELGQVLFEAF